MMNFRLLRVVMWCLACLVLLESLAEFRAHSRGFTTIIFGSFPREKVPTTESSSPSGTNEVVVADTVKKKPGEMRYWIASSSHAEDVYLSREVIFPSRLEQLFQKPGIPVVVINASRAGMDIEANRADLESRGINLKPDVVVLYQMSLQITKLSKQFLSRNQPDPNKVKSFGTSKPARPSWITQLYENTSLYALLKGNVSTRLTAQRVLADSLGQQAELEFERQVKEFVTSVRKLRAEPVLCTFATSHTQRNMPHVPGEVTDFLFRYNVYLSLSGWFETLSRFNQILKRLADEEHLRLVDLDAVLSGHPEYFRDFVHFTPEGHQKVAETIYAELQTQVPKRLASTTAKAQ